MSLDKLIASHVWNKNGDHPHDRCWMVVVEDQEPFPSEGKVVRYYRRPEEQFSGDNVCPHCHKTLHEHGFIDSGCGGQVVCPGMFILTFGEPGNPDAPRRYMAISPQAHALIAHLPFWAITAPQAPDSPKLPDSSSPGPRGLPDGS